MTVTSLWKILDHAGCGEAIGAEDLIKSSRTPSDRINPWNFNPSILDSRSEQRPVLAIDLSIWICEGLTSPAIAANHSNPALYLAFSRSVKLLSMGIKLIVVIEGQRRVRRTEELDSLRKRRTGTAFWKACKDCERMFECMGIPVVKAVAEGEALCALLNQRGIVDGVVSNDGDCLLFGAKVVYTKFSIENLLNSEVIRYVSTDLAAIVQDENDEARDPLDCAKVSLSRQDLISFALLTGSDLAGNGLPNIGHKKAIRFIYKCKHDHPLTPESAAIDELCWWARTAAKLRESGCMVGTTVGKERCCAICSHPGDKRRHSRHGCEICGTEAGEPCFPFTGSDRFRESLRIKALALEPAFAPLMVVDAYSKPNDNSVPLVLDGISAATLEMSKPRIQDLLELNLIVKGQSHAASSVFVIDSMSRLLVRHHLFGQSTLQIAPERRCLSSEIPIPIRITRQLVRDKMQCLEVLWRVNATVTDSEGKGIDGYEFSTIEDIKVFTKQFPDIVSCFQKDEVDRERQGNKEREKRKSFIESFLKLNVCDPDHFSKEENKETRKRRGRKKCKTEGFFGCQHARLSLNKTRTLVDVTRTEEMKALMRPFLEVDKSDEYDHSTITSVSDHCGACAPAEKVAKRFGRPRMRMTCIQPVGMTIAIMKSTDEQISVVKHLQQESKSEAFVQKESTFIKQPQGHLSTSRSKVAMLDELPEKSLASMMDSNPAHNLALVDRNHEGLEPLQSRNELAGFSCLETSERPLADEFTIRHRLIRIAPIFAAKGESIESPSNHVFNAYTPEQTEKVSLDPRVNRAVRCNKTITCTDPDAWIARVVSEDDSSDANDFDVIRRLLFDDVDKGIGSENFPSLTPGHHHLIECDMGIPVSVTPLVARGSLFLHA